MIAIVYGFEGVYLGLGLPKSYSHSLKPMFVGVIWKSRRV